MLGLSKNEGGWRPLRSSSLNWDDTGTTLAIGCMVYLEVPRILELDGLDTLSEGGTKATLTWWWEIWRLECTGR
jgi:hypothetical protein